MIFYDLPMHSSPFRVCVFCAHSRGPLGRQTFKFTATPLLLGLGFDASHLFLFLVHFQQHLDSTGQLNGSILWYEALCVAAALEYAASLDCIPHRLAIFTDRLDTVEIFSSLRASWTYNPILFFCRILLECDFNLRVYHVPGDDNVVADALSRGLLHGAGQP